MLLDCFNLFEITTVWRKTFKGENIHESVEIGFLWGKLAVCSLVLSPKDANFAKKTFVHSNKSSKFAEVFSLERFPLYSTNFNQVKKQHMEEIFLQR